MRRVFVFLLSCLFLFTAQSSMHNGQEIFLVKELTTDSVLAPLDVSALVEGVSNPSLALLGNNVVLETSTGVYFLNTSAVENSYQFLDQTPLLFVGDVASSQILAFVDDENNYLDSPGFVYKLARITPTLPPQATQIALAEPIFVGFCTGIFTSNEGLYIQTGGEMFFINTVTGAVVEEEFTAFDQWVAPDGFVAAGAMGYYTFEDIYVIYANAAGGVEQQNTRSDRGTEVVYSGPADVTNVAIDPRAQAWAHIDDSLAVIIAHGDFINAWPTSQPSAQPSTQPSTQPTSMPSLHPEAPKVLTLTIEATSTKATLIAQLDFNAIFPGTVYCAAFRQGTTVTSTSQVVTSGSGVEYPPGLSSVTVVLQGLSPVTSYEAYCYAVTQQGFTNSLMDVLSTRQVLQTSCCLALAFANAPAFVYSDPAAYVAASSGTSTGTGTGVGSGTGTAAQPGYAFTYLLPAAPRALLTVTPVVTVISPAAATASGSAPVTVVASVPATTFAPNATVLSASFALVGSDHRFNGTVQVALVLEGLSSGEYGSQSTPVKATVQMLSIDTPPPPPTLASARFSNAGASLFLVYDSNTDRAGKVVHKAYPCTDLFTFPADDRTSCLWINNTHVEATFAASSGNSAWSLPEIGDEVTPKANRTKALCVSGATTCASYGFTSTVAVAIQPPLRAIVPRVVLTVPTTLTGCDNLTVSASLSSGSAGRSWASANWTVSARGTLPIDTSAITAWLHARGVRLDRTISVPHELFETGKYTITLVLTNFLGQRAAATAIVDSSVQSELPRLQVFGASSMHFTANQEVSVYARALYSSCTGGNASLVYTWTLFDEAWARVPVASTSTDPAVFTLAAFALTPGTGYMLQCNSSVWVNGSEVGTSSMRASVYIDRGEVQAIVSGGSVRQTSRTGTLVLDASASYDEDFSSVGLAYRWSCVLTSLGRYGQSCDDIFSTSTSTLLSNLTVSGAALNSSDEYLFTVVVTTQDGRADSEQVSVTVADDDAAYVELFAKTSHKFNADQPLALSGLIQTATTATQSSLTTNARWEVLVDGLPVNVSALTLMDRDFAAKYVAAAQITALLIAADTFVKGTRVTFRLTATTYEDSRRRLRHATLMDQIPLDAGNRALTTLSRPQPLAQRVVAVSVVEIAMLANVPPLGGQLVVDPSAGTALSTEFDMESSGWTDDPADYPLTFDFRFVQYPSAPALTIKGRSTSNMASAALPAGLQSYDENLVATSRVYDSLGAYTAANATVHVVFNSGVNVDGYLDRGLDVAMSAGNVDDVLSVTNNVASTINLANCSMTSAAFCQSLNREPCTTVANTCQGCSAGFIGVVGPANSLCFNASASSPAAVGAPCSTNTDCLYGLCNATTATCAFPPQICPSANTAECSGHGQCRHPDQSGNELPISQCLVDNVHCKPKCLCDSGYGGTACDIDSDLLEHRDYERYRLCDAVIFVCSIANPSPQLVESVAGSLLASYDRFEVFSQRTTQRCYDALSTVSLLAARVDLSTASPSTPSYLVTAASEFADAPSSNALSVSDTASAVSNSMGNITLALLSAMTNGQDAVHVISDNVQISFERPFVTDLYNTSLLPPPSEAELVYGVLPSTVALDVRTADSCSNGDNFVPISVMKWNTNPYPNSSASLSNLLRLTQSFDRPTSIVSTATQGRLHRDDALVYSINRHSSDAAAAIAATATSASSPGYSLTFQFSAVQDFNFSVTPEQARTLPPRNFTFPDCSYNVNGKYVTCQGCNVTSYTNFNVTYLCTDPSQICTGGASPASTAEALLHNLESWHWRTTADDSTPPAGSQMSQYAALFTAVKGVLVSVLSGNPFAIDLEQAKAILSFSLCLLFIIVYGGIYFHRWDLSDRDQLIYAKRWPPKQIRGRPLKDKAYSKKQLLDTHRGNYSLTLDNVNHSRCRSGSDRSSDAEANREPSDVVVKKLGLHVPSSSSDSATANGPSTPYLPVLMLPLPSSSSSVPATPVAGEENKRSGRRVNGIQIPLLAMHRVGTPVPGDDSNIDHEVSIAPLAHPSAVHYAGQSTAALKQQSRVGTSTSPKMPIPPIAPVDPLVMYCTTNFYDLAMPDVFTEGGEPGAKSVGAQDRYQQIIQSATVPAGSIWHLVKTLVERHDYSSIFTKPSVSLPRMIRFVGLMKSILIGFFIDTIFFSVFYSNTGTCEGYTNAYDCELEINGISSESTCEWSVSDGAISTGSISDTQGSCALREPPSNLMFVLILALICTLVGVPLDLLCSFILEEYAAKRPDFSEWGWINEYWLGRSTKSDDLAPQMNSVLEGGEEESLPCYLRSEECFRRTVMCNPNLSTLFKELSMAERQWPAAVRHLMLTNHEHNEINRVHLAYLKFHSPSDEVQYLNALIQMYNHHYAALEGRVTSGRYSTAAVGQTGKRWDEMDTALLETYTARCHILRKHLGIYINGKIRNLRWFDYLWYRNNVHKMMAKLKSIRRKEKQIEQTLRDTEIYDEDVKEGMVMQFFVMEQFDSFHRFILRNQFFAFDNYSPEVIDGKQWIAAWLFIIGSMAFYLYWMLMWGVQSGELLLSAWGLNFAVGALQDIFFVQIFKILAVFLISIVSLRPKLLKLRLVLQGLTMQYVRGQFPARKLMPYGEMDLTKAPDLAQDVFRGVYHENINMLNLFQVPLIHLISPVSRVVASSKQGKQLGIVKILKNIDDIDILAIRKICSNSMHRSAFAISFAVIPFVAIAFMGDSAGDLFIDFLLPTMSSFFILANSMLLNVSIYALSFLYVGGFLYLLWKRRSVEVMYAQAKALYRERRQRHVKRSSPESRALSQLLPLPMRLPRRQRPLWRMLCGWTVKRSILLLSTLNELLVTLHNALFLLPSRAHRHQTASRSATWQLLNAPLAVQGRSFSARPFRPSISNPTARTVFPEPVLAMRVYALDPNAASLSASLERRGDAFVQRFDVSQNLPPSADLTHIDDSVTQRTLQQRILRGYVSTMLHRHVLHAPVVYDEATLAQDVARPHYWDTLLQEDRPEPRALALSRTLSQGTVRSPRTEDSTPALNPSSAEWFQQPWAREYVLARSRSETGPLLTHLLIAVMEAYLLRVNETTRQVQAQRQHRLEVFRQTQTEMQVELETQSQSASQRVVSLSPRTQYALQAAASVDSAQGSNSSNLAFFLSLYQASFSQKSQALSLPPAQREQNGVESDVESEDSYRFLRMDGVQINETYMDDRGRDRGLPVPAAQRDPLGAPLPSLSLSWRGQPREGAEQMPEQDASSRFPARSAQVEDGLGDSADPAAMARRVVELDLSLVLVIADLPAALRDVLRTFPFYRYLKEQQAARTMPGSATEEDVGLTEAVFPSATLKAAEAEELAQGFNVFLHTFRASRIQNGIPYTTVRQQIAVMVDAVRVVFQREVKRAQVKHTRRLKDQLLRKGRRRAATTGASDASDESAALEGSDEERGSGGELASSLAELSSPSRRWSQSERPSSSLLQALRVFGRTSGSVQASDVEEMATVEHRRAEASIWEYHEPEPEPEPEPETPREKAPLSAGRSVGSDTDTDADLEFGLSLYA